LKKREKRLRKRGVTGVKIGRSSSLPKLPPLSLLLILLLRKSKLPPLLLYIFLFFPSYPTLLFLYSIFFPQAPSSTPLYVPLLSFPILLYYSESFPIYIIRAQVIPKINHRNQTCVNIQKIQIISTLRSVVGV
jgi:hypothetical protein